MQRVGSPLKRSMAHTLPCLSHADIRPPLCGSELSSVAGTPVDHRANNQVNAQLMHKVVCEWQAEGQEHGQV
jgi:hypothetical protein